MSYQVLARKWRPRAFETLVGQEHVVRALRHALDQQRLHHAWLFTGTRGVGKTTLSRILAKCLNCIGPDGNGGITSVPCGVCRPCVDIDAGRFVDYIEMDAASNRGVEEMATLLEQAVYAPANARFKVYMIDEVHQLSSHAFNAMLKTLEEPPEHVKFILATTDPQKIPVTVLSRCLQFNLKQMPVAEIATHLAQVLEAEAVPFERAALALLGRAAAGSMRDALSLTDQAIAYGGGTVGDTAVRGMLGALDQTYLLRILDALADGDGPALMAIVDEIAERSLSFGGALQDLGVLLHRIALVQTVERASSDDEDADAVHVRLLASRLAPEDVQLWYQMAAHGRRDLTLAPDETTGFSMTLLRMLAFRIDASATGETVAPAATSPVGKSDATPDQRRRAAPPAAPSRPSQDALPAAPERVPPPAARSAPPAVGVASSERSPRVAGPVQAARVDDDAAVRPALFDDAPARAPQAAAPPRPVPEDILVSAQAVEPPALAIDDWVAVVERLGLTGLTQQLVQQSELVAHDARSVRLRVPVKSMLTGPAQIEKLKAALAKHFGRKVDVVVEVGAVTGTTAASTRSEERAARQADAEALIHADPFVQAVVRDFGGAAIVPGSVKPV